MANWYSFKRPGLTFVYGYGSRDAADVFEDYFGGGGGLTSNPQFVGALNIGSIEAALNSMGINNWQTNEPWIVVDSPVRADASARLVRSGGMTPTRIDVSSI